MTVGARSGATGGPAGGPAGPAEDAAIRAGELRHNLADVRARIATAARAAGRDPATLTLIAVSKTWPATDVVTMAGLGVDEFGENRDQEGHPKSVAVATARSAAGADAVTWHFIGRLQRNKARAVASWADWIHSVDRESLVSGLEAGAAAAGRTPRVCIQVSLDPSGDGPAAGSGGPTRGGVAPEAVDRIAELVAQAPHLRLAGVMAVAPFGRPARPAFARLRVVRDRLLADHPGATVISAGMSGDLADAIAEGATHLRVGTALFGHRPRFP
ncbi:MAG: YggS family pyridoxal phosphate-dependent enzyme [Frankia sp.]